MTQYVFPTSGEAAPQGGMFHSGRSGGARNHAGVDFHGPNGSKAVAVIGGKVLHVGFAQGYQNYAIVQGDDGNMYRYATHGPVSVKVGQYVAQGAPIGTIARGHVHFEVAQPGDPGWKSLKAGGITQWWGKNKPVTSDPAKVLGFKPGTMSVAGKPVGPGGVASLVPPADIPNVPGEAAPAGPRTLRKGSSDRTTSGAVTRLQQQLKAAGFNPGPVDGKFGPQTEKAVRAAEQKYGLSVERPGKGAAGPQVQSALELASHPAYAPGGAVMPPPAYSPGGSVAPPVGRFGTTDYFPENVSSADYTTGVPGRTGALPAYAPGGVARQDINRFDTEASAPTPSGPQSPSGEAAMWDRWSKSPIGSQLATEYDQAYQNALTHQYTTGRNLDRTGLAVRDVYETELSPKEEAQFQEWKAVNAPNDTGEDYDLRGAFKAGLRPAENGHWSDEFKKPNHPTFSDQSKYSTQEHPGGHWYGDQFVAPGGSPRSPTTDTIYALNSRIDPNMGSGQDASDEAIRAALPGAFAKATEAKAASLSEPPSYAVNRAYAAAHPPPRFFAGPGPGELSPPGFGPPPQDATLGAGGASINDVLHGFGTGFGLFGGTEPVAAKSSLPPPAVSEPYTGYIPGGFSWQAQDKPPQQQGSIGSGILQHASGYGMPQSGGLDGLPQYAALGGGVPAVSSGPVYATEPTWPGNYGYPSDRNALARGPGLVASAAAEPSFNSGVARGFPSPWQAGDEAYNSEPRVGAVPAGGEPYSAPGGPSMYNVPAMNMGPAMSMDYATPQSAYTPPPPVSLAGSEQDQLTRAAEDLPHISSTGVAGGPVPGQLGQTNYGSSQGSGGGYGSGGGFTAPYLYPSPSGQSVWSPSGYSPETHTPYINRTGETTVDQYGNTVNVGYYSMNGKTHQYTY